MLDESSGAEGKSSSRELYHQALSHYKAGSAGESIRLLGEVIALDPSFEDAYEALAVVLYNHKKYEESIAVAERWAKLNPNSVMARTNLSRCYVAKGMIEEAEREQNEARRLTWKAELSRKPSMASKIDYEESVAKYKRIIEYDPEDVLGYYSLGTVYLDNGKKREAMDTYEKAIQVNPHHTSSYWGLGQALEMLGDIEKAKKVYREGIKVAEEQGDMMPQRKMESRLKALEKKE